MIVGVYTLAEKRGADARDSSIVPYVVGFAAFDKESEGQMEAIKGYGQRVTGKEASVSDTRGFIAKARVIADTL
jgi:hypothetical protein